MSTMIEVPTAEEIERLLRFATPEEMQRLAAMVEAHAPPWSPKPRQRMALDSPAYEVFFGGAAGGGKTSLLVGATLHHHRSLIVRRQATELQEIIDQAIRIYNRDCFREDKKRFTLPKGKMIELTGMKEEWDWERWKGRPHDYLAFDEVTEFLQTQYEMMGGWIRSTKEGQRTRRINTFNPPNSATAAWVLKKIEPWVPMARDSAPRMDSAEIAWFAKKADGSEISADGPDEITVSGETMTPWSRTFVKSLLTDNPFLADTDYAQRLESLPEPLRSQLLYGDMSLSRQDAAMQVIPSEWVDLAFRRWETRGGKRPDGVPLHAIGGDASRGGQDRTVMYPRYGTFVGVPTILAGEETRTSAPATAAFMRIRGSETGAWGVLDANGVGAALADGLRAAGVPILAIMGQAKTQGWSHDTTGMMAMFNDRAYGYWTLREMLDPEKGAELALPPGDDLRAELTAPTWHTNRASGAVQIEDKDGIKKRIGRSPDLADAVVLACSYVRAGLGPVGAARAAAGGRNTKKKRFRLPFMSGTLIGR